MALTTFHAIREAQYTAIIGITPQSLSGERFRAAEEDVEDFRDWASLHPQASFRRVAINDLGETIDGPILDTARVFVEAEIVVAYPADARYGTPKKRMREKVMREDHVSIEANAGVLARMLANMSVDASIVGPSPPFTMERLGPVVFLVYPYIVAFTRDANP